MRVLGFRELDERVERVERVELERADVFFEAEARRVEPVDLEAPVTEPVLPDLAETPFFCGEADEEPPTCFLKAAVLAALERTLGLRVVFGLLSLIVVRFCCFLKLFVCAHHIIYGCDDGEAQPKVNKPDTP